MNLTCPGCGATATASGRSNTQIRESTGWHPVMDTGNGIEFFHMCPACFDVCKEHVKAVLALTKHEYTHFLSFVPKGTRL